MLACGVFAATGIWSAWAGVPADFSGTILAINSRTNGAIFVGGTFTNFNAAGSQFIARLNADGSTDTTFTPAPGPNGYVHAIVVQVDGKVLIGGGFDTVNGVVRFNLARFNPDGSLDPRFAPILDGVNGTVLALGLRGINQIYLAGDFTSVGGTRRLNYARMKSDGWLDPGFDPIGFGANAAVRALLVQPDGNVLIAGDFSEAAGFPRSRIARLQPDGLVDFAFNAGIGTDGIVRALALQNDGKIVLGGEFLALDGRRRSRIARLNADGSLDAAFDPGLGADASIFSLAVQTDGKILAGGAFANFDGQPRNRIARLNADGSLDGTFDLGGGADGSMNAMALTTGGRLLLGGNFTFVGGIQHDYFAALTNFTRLSASQIEFVSAKYSVPESADSIQLSLIRNGDVTTPASVDFSTIDATALGGVDYVPLTSTIIFNAGETNHTISVSLRNDHVFDGGEFFYLALSNVVGAAQLGSQSSARIAITEVNSPVVGGVDPDFGSLVSADGDVAAVVIQTDGKILLAGDFQNTGPVQSPRLARLNTNGSFDTSFDVGSGPDGRVRAIISKTDRGILIGGDFGAVGGISRQHIAQLWPDGRLDLRFDPGTGTDGLILAMVSAPDQQTLIAGNFTLFNGVRRSRIARLFWGGALDPGFDPSGLGLNDSVNALMLQPDNKVIVAGVFSRAGQLARSRIARLHEDGSVDASFDSGAGIDGPVLALALRADGAVWIAGEFTQVQNVPRKFVARLTASGALDASFDPGASADARIRALAAQSDGKVWIGGDFTDYAGFGRSHFVRLQNSGAVDECLGTGTGADGSVNSIALDSSGAILLGGDFQTVNNFHRPFFARLIGDSPADFSEVSITALRRAANGEIAFSVSAQPGRCYIIEASNDLNNWSPLATNRAAGAVLDFEDPGSAILPFRFYRVRREP